MDNAALPPAPMKMSHLFKQMLHWSGSGLAILGIVFVIFRLQNYWLELNLSKITPLAWCLIAIITVLYGTANLFLASAWWHLLKYLGTDSTHINAVKIYGVSQLARYLPGNIFHLAGRQALGMAAGIPGGILAKSIIWELGLIAITGALFGWLILPLIADSLPQAIGVFLLIIGAITVAISLGRHFGIHIFWAFFLQMLFLLTIGVVFVVMLDLVSGKGVLPYNHWAILGGAYIVAWLAGLVTPGAPAGIGIRELVLMILLKDITTEINLLMAVLLCRIVTIFGDFLFFLATILTTTKDLRLKNQFISRQL